MHPRLLPLNRNVLIFSGALVIIIFLIRLGIIVSQSPDFSGCESNVVYGMQRILSDQPLYTDTKVLPYAIIQYTPLYYHLCTTTARLFGFGTYDLYPLYVIGRIWNLLFNVLTALIVFRIAKKILHIPFGYAILIALLSFGFEYYQNFAVRGDSMQDLCALGAVFFFLRFLTAAPLQRSVLRFLLPAIVLTALSTFAKQSGLQVILIFGGYCLLTGNWKGLLWTSVFGAVAFGLPLLFIASSNAFFFQNVVGGVSNGISFQNFFRYIVLKKYFLVTVVPLAAYVCYAAVKKNGFFTGSPVDRFLYFFAAGTLGFATLTGLKAGATVQYYFLFLNASMLLLFHNLGRSAPAGIGAGSDRMIRLLGPYACFCLLIYLIWDVKLLKLISYDAKGADDRSQVAAVSRYLQTELARDTVAYFFANLTIDPANFPARQQINNVLFTRSAIPQLDVMHYASTPVKVLGYDDFERNLKTGRIAWLVESVPAYPVPVSAHYDSLKKQFYKLRLKMNHYAIFHYEP